MRQNEFKPDPDGVTASKIKNKVTNCKLSAATPAINVFEAEMYTCGANHPNRAEIECWSKVVAKVLSNQVAKMIKHQYVRLAIVYT